MSKRKGRIFTSGWKNSVPYPLKVMRGKKIVKSVPSTISTVFCMIYGVRYFSLEPVLTGADQRMV